MPAGLIISIVVLVALIAAVWMTFNILGVVVTLVIAALVGLVADRIVPGQLPYGWVGAIAAGLLGSWIGSTLLGSVGPVIASIPVVPALVGAILVAFLVEILVKRGAPRRAT